VITRPRRGRVDVKGAGVRVMRTTRTVRMGSRQCGQRTGLSSVYSAAVCQSPGSLCVRQFVHVVRGANCLAAGDAASGAARERLVTKRALRHLGTAYRYRAD